MRVLLLTVVVGCALAASVDKEKRGVEPTPTYRPMPTPTESIGDIEDHQRVKRDTPGDCPAVHQWPNDRICEINNPDFQDANMEALLNKAKAIFTDVSCATFITDSDIDCDVEPLQVTNSDDGCFADIGSSTWSQTTMNLAKPCSACDGGVVLHELFHVLGRYHEHTRPDRDEYVTVNTANIRSGSEHNFKACKRAIDFGIPYDYESIMHYGKNFFSGNDEDTLAVKNSSFENRIGKQMMLSPLDIKTVNMMYNCYDGKNIDHDMCNYGGVMTNREQCHCVWPFKGTYCTEIEDGAEHFQCSGGESQNVESVGHVGGANYPPMTNEVFVLECTDRTMRVSVTFDTFSLEAYRCGYDKFRIFMGAGSIYPVRIACAQDLLHETVTSDDYLMILQLTSDEEYNYPGFGGTFTCVAGN